MGGARRRAAATGLTLALCWVAGCPSAPPDPMRYRLTGSGTHWDVVGDDRVLDDLRPRYPEFFALVLDPSRTEEANLLELRDDLERMPGDRRNYDALNTLAIAYFELNHRGESLRGRGLGFMSQGFRAAQLLAVPWRAYPLVDDPRLRDAILDFFDDASSGTKLASRRTAPRLTRIVSSLARHEDDPARLARIHGLVTRLLALERELAAERGAGSSQTP
ncbi:MAG: hypothetical protein ACQGVK_20940 [Myxococcota bacterium]